FTEQRGKFNEGGDQSAAKRFETSGFGFVTGPRKFALPGFALPTFGQSFVFEPVDLVIRIVHKTGLEGGKPILVSPMKANGQQGSPREFSQRMMRYGLTAIHEEWNLKASKHTAQRIVVIVQMPNKHRDFPITPART